MPWFRKGKKSWVKVQLNPEDEKFIDELTYSPRVAYMEAILHKHSYKLFDANSLSYVFKCNHCPQHWVVTREELWPNRYN